MGPPKFPQIIAEPPRGSVLVLAPHPDDESLGCGGVIALHHRQGDRVTVVVATDGAAGDPMGYYRDCDYPALRREEAGRAASILGIDTLEFWGYPDGQLAEATDLAVRLQARLVADRPDIVYRPSTLELHADHWALGLAAQEALRQYRPPCGDFCYEVWATVQPTHCLNITPVWDLKRNAVEQYASQLRYNDLLHMMSGLNAYRTLVAPWARYVEAFQAG